MKDVVEKVENRNLATDTPLLSNDFVCNSF